MLNPAALHEVNTIATFDSCIDSVALHRCRYTFDAGFKSDGGIGSSMNQLTGDDLHDVGHGHLKTLSFTVLNSPNFRQMQCLQN